MHDNTTEYSKIVIKSHNPNQSVYRGADYGVLHKPIAFQAFPAGADALVSLNSVPCGAGPARGAQDDRRDEYGHQSREISSSHSASPMVPGVGIEPTTPAFSGPRSTPELPWLLVSDVEFYAEPGALSNGFGGVTDRLRAGRFPLPVRTTGEKSRRPLTTKTREIQLHSRGCRRNGP